MLKERKMTVGLNLHKIHKRNVVNCAKCAKPVNTVKICSNFDYHRNATLYSC